MKNISFSVIGINHNHIYGQVDALLRAGAIFLSFAATEPELGKSFARKYPQAEQVESPQQILEDRRTQLIVTAAIPSERAPLGMQVMEHGKDFMSDKPGFTTLEQLQNVRRVQAKTKRIYSIYFSERFACGSAIKAGKLVRSGVIGQVIQTIGLGPHRIGKWRPDWFFDRLQHGGILTDIGSHQADQFLYFTGSTKAEVVSSQVANYRNPQYPGFEDFGDMMIRGDGGTGYVRVDWYTPDGLGTWGDGRLIILGTDGYIELRKYIDVLGRAGKDHLFLVDRHQAQYLDCSQEEQTYGQQLVEDILNRTEKTMPQDHCFLASKLALDAEASAKRLGYLSNE